MCDQNYPVIDVLPQLKNLTLCLQYKGIQIQKDMHVP